MIETRLGEFEEVILPLVFSLLNADKIHDTTRCGRIGDEILSTRFFQIAFYWK
jgi:hypothetical protein